MIEKQTISINLAKGIDQAFDEVLPQNDSFGDVVNASFDKVGRMAKREGLKETSMTIDNNSTPVRVIGSDGFVIDATPKRAIISDNGLFVENKSGNLDFKHGYENLTYTEQLNIPLHGKLLSYDEADFGQYKVLFYLVFEGDSHVIQARYSVYDKTNQKTILYDSLIESVSTEPMFFGDIRDFFKFDLVQSGVASFTSKLYFLFKITASDLTPLAQKLIEINTTTFAVTSNATTAIEATGKVFNITGTGERYIVFQHDGDDGLYDSTMTRTHTFGAWVIPTSTTYSAPYQRPHVFYSSEIDRIVCFTYGQFCSTWNISGASLVKVAHYDAASVLPVAPTEPPDVSGFVSLDYEYKSGKINLPDWFPLFYNDFDIDRCVVYLTHQAHRQTIKLVFTASALESSNYDQFSNQTMLLETYATDGNSKNIGFTYFVDATYDDIVNTADAYRSVVAFDLVNKNINSKPSILNKIFEFEANFISSKQVALISSNVFYKSFSRSISYIGDEGQDQDEIVLCRYTLSQIPYTIEAGSQTLIGGGLLSSYDGSILVEQGFLLKPKKPIIYVDKQTVDNYSLHETITVDAFNSILRKIQYPPASEIKKGPANYYVHYKATASGTNLVWTSTKVWYQIDGEGTAPAAPYVTVAIQRDDTAYQVATKTMQAIVDDVNYAPGGGFFVTARGEVYRREYAGSGILTDDPTPAAVAAFTRTGIVIRTPVGQGVVSVCYQLIGYDELGNEFRSELSDIAQVTTTQTLNNLYMTIALNYLTNKKFERTGVVVYRSLPNGTILYKTAVSTPIPVSWSPTREDIRWETQSYISALIDFDSMSGGVAVLSVRTDDSVLNMGEVLPTTGGVLDNGTTLNNVRHLSLFKERVVVTKFDDYGQFYYSKPILKKLCPEFPIEFIFDLNTKTEFIVGTKALDDKLLIFNSDSVYAVSGDGPNNLGTGDSWSLPFLITSSTGCTTEKSICEIPGGVVFKSSSFWKLIDRGLAVQPFGMQIRDIDYDSEIASTIFVENATYRALLIIPNNSAKSTIAYFVDYNLFSRFTNFYGNNALVIDGVVWLFRGTGKLAYTSSTQYKDDTSGTYNLEFTTEWLSLSKVQDYQRVSRISVLGRYLTSNKITLRSYYNYDEGSYHDYELLSSSIIEGSGYGKGTYQAQFHLAQQKVESIKFRVQVVPQATLGTEQGATLTDMSLYVGLKRGLMKVSTNKKR